MFLNPCFVDFEIIESHKSRNRLVVEPLLDWFRRNSANDGIRRNVFANDGTGGNDPPVYCHTIKDGCTVPNPHIVLKNYSAFTYGFRCHIAQSLNSEGKGAKTSSRVINVYDKGNV